jgi:hypothetical protein
LAEDRRQNDDETRDDLLVVARQRQKIETVADDAEDQHADECPLRAALAAAEAGAADDAAAMAVSSNQSRHSARPMRRASRGDAHPNQI